MTWWHVRYAVRLALIATVVQGMPLEFRVVTMTGFVVWFGLRPMPRATA
jgi:hypothetical protein